MKLQLVYDLVNHFSLGSDGDPHFLLTQECINPGEGVMEGRTHFRCA